LKADALLATGPVLKKQKIDSVQVRFITQIEDPLVKQQLQELVPDLEQSSIRDTDLIARIFLAIDDKTGLENIAKKWLAERHFKYIGLSTLFDLFTKAGSEIKIFLDLLKMDRDDPEREPSLSLYDFEFRILPYVQQTQNRELLNEVVKILEYRKNQEEEIYRALWEKLISVANNLLNVAHVSERSNDISQDLDQAEKWFTKNKFELAGHYFMDANNVEGMVRAAEQLLALQETASGGQNDALAALKFLLKAAEIIKNSTL